jgi:hypothetical protein
MLLFGERFAKQWPVYSRNIFCLQSIAYNSVVFRTDMALNGKYKK